MNAMVQQIYKIVVSADGKTLLGGVLVGDAGDYATLLQMMLNGMALPSRPESLILPAMDGATTKALGVAALPDSAQICSCHNVSKETFARRSAPERAIWRQSKAVLKRRPAAGAVARWSNR